MECAQNVASAITEETTPEALIDVTIQPIIFLALFTYIFGGAIAGDVASYLPVLIPGILVQTVITGSVVTGAVSRPRRVSNSLYSTA